jgi:hypothetical protein
VGASCKTYIQKHPVKYIKHYSPGFDCVDLSSTVAGSLSLFVVCFCSNVENGVLIPIGGALEESSDGNDELSSLRWKNSVGVDPKVDSGSNAGIDVPTGGVKDSTDAYDELSSLSWKSSGEGIRKRNQAESLGVYKSTYN